MHGPISRAQIYKCWFYLVPIYKLSGSPNKYKNKARTTKYCRTQASHVGPLDQRLQGFGDIQASNILMEVPPLSVSEQGLLHHIRRRLSVSIITAHSRSLPTHLHHMVPGAKETAKKCDYSKHREELVKNYRL